MHEDRLDLVAAIVAQRDLVKTELSPGGFEEAIPRLPADLFKIPALLFVPHPGIHAPFFQWKKEPLEKILDKDLFRPGFRTAKPVIEIDPDDPDTPFPGKSLQGPKEGNGIRPTGDGHQDPVAGLQHAVFLDRSLDL